VAKKEKIAIKLDKAIEPIDDELDAAMGLLDSANRHITELLTSLDAAPQTITITPATELDESGNLVEAAIEEAATPEQNDGESKAS
jgi:hypothetical protein